jgi:hypothetical protein
MRWKPPLDGTRVRSMQTRLGIGIAVAVFAAAMGLVGGVCPAGAAPAKRTCKSPAKFHGVHASNYNINCVSCKIFGQREVAKENGIRSKDAVTIALRYANKAYRLGFRQAAFEGCLQGFLIRGRP